MATSDDGDDDISNLKSTVDLSENGATLNQSDHNPSEVTDQVDNIGSVTHSRDEKKMIGFNEQDVQAAKIALQHAKIILLDKNCSNLRHQN